MELEIAVGLEGHRANELRNDQRGRVQRGAQGSSTRERTLRAGEVAWRRAGSTGNAAASNVRPAATDLRLDDKRSHPPLWVQIERRREGVANLGLVVHEERDEPLLLEDVGGSGRHGRRLRPCVHTVPHNRAQISDCRRSEEGVGRPRRSERQAWMWRAVMGVAGERVMGWLPRMCWARLLTCCCRHRDATP